MIPIHCEKFGEIRFSNAGVYEVTMWTEGVANYWG